MTKRYYQEIPSRVFVQPEPQASIAETQPDFQLSEEDTDISCDTSVSTPSIESTEIESKTAAFNLFGNLFDSETNKIFGLIALDDIILLVLIFLFLSDFLNDDILLLIFAAIFILGL